MNFEKRQKSPIMKTFLAIFALLVLNTEAWQQSDRVLLEEVKAITLHQGRMTNGRRSSPVPQLKCVGGSAQSRFQPQTVQCINMGSDGHDVQWECKADMDNAYRFGKVQVNCEGYDSPYDPYVLKGSCGLEYTIDLTEEGFQKNYHKQSGGYSHSNNYQNSEKSGGLGGLVVYIGVLFAIYCIYKIFIQPNQQGGQRAPPQGPAPPPYGFRPEFSQPPQGPPPTYESTQQGPYAHASAPREEHMGDSNSGPGFWTGAATGAGLGYMFGSSRNRGREQVHHHHHDNAGGSWFGNNQSNTGGGSWFGNNQQTRDRTPSPSPSSGTRTASGFGGTSRR